MLRVLRFDFRERRDNGSEGWLLVPLMHETNGSLGLPPTAARVDCFVKSPQDPMHIAFGGRVTPEGKAWLNMSDYDGVVLMHSWNISSEHCFCLDFRRLVENAGGDLDFSFSTGRKLQLRLVLSAEPPTWPVDFVSACPQTPTLRKATLEQALFERFPTRTETWMQEAIVAYYQFLDLQAEALQKGGIGFSPSPQIDAIWHVHLSLSEQYSDDCTYRYGEVVPHRPTLNPEQSRDSYGRAFEEIFGKRHTISTEFWPLPATKRLRGDGVMKEEYSCEHGRY